MIIAILILFYIGSIFLCRYAFRMQYIWHDWLKKDVKLNILWFIPFGNFIVGILFLIVGYPFKKISFTNKFLRWFSNQDL
jgi:hypothetical protein